MIESIAPGVLVTEVALGDYDVRGALLVDDSRVVVWDTLSHPRDMAGWLPLIGEREVTVVYSHADWDHIWGTARLPLRNATIVGHRACRERFLADAPRTLCERQRAEPGTWDEVALVVPNTVFDARMVVPTGSMTLELHHLPGHTADSIVGFVPERGLLLAGDAVETPFPVVPPDSPLDAWIAGLEYWARDPRVRTVVPAHGPIGDVRILLRNIDYLRALRSGVTADPAGPLTDFYRRTHAENLRWRKA